MVSFCRIGLLACLLGSTIGRPTEQTQERDTASVAAAQWTRYRPYVLPKLRNWTAKGKAPTYGFIPVEDLDADFGNLTVVSASSDVDPVLLDDRGVIGGDDRKVIDSTRFPYSAIGRIVWSDGTFCTAALVADRVILTASHCVPWGQSGISIVFQPDFFDKERFGRANVIAVNAVYQNPVDNFDPTPCGIEKDFAVMQLDARFSSKVGGFMGVAQWSSATSTGLTHVGYPIALSNGGRPYYQSGVSANLDGSYACDSVGPLTSLVDTSEGHSGGPLFTSSNTIVAVFSAGGKNTNAFATGNMPALVAWARSNWA